MQYNKGKGEKCSMQNVTAKLCVGLLGRRDLRRFRLLLFELPHPLLTTLSCSPPRDFSPAWNGVWLLPPVEGKGRR